MDVNSISRLQDLRIKIINNEPVTAEEMLQVLAALRQGRRSAAETGTKKKPGKVPEDILSVFDAPVSE